MLNTRIFLSASRILLKENFKIIKGILLGFIIFVVVDFVNFFLFWNLLMKNNRVSSPTYMPRHFGRRVTLGA